MNKNSFNNNVCVILFNTPSIQIIFNYINNDKNKFKNIINNKLSLLINKYKFYSLNLKDPLGPKIPGEINNNITYIKKYISYLYTIINNNYEFPENELNILISLLNESINIFLDKIKIKTVDFSKSLTFYKNSYNNNCWINKFIQILGCQPVFTKHFEKYVKNAYINYSNSTKEQLKLSKLNITLPEYNYIFNNFPLYNYDILQNILDKDNFIDFNKYIILPENVEINIIDPYYLLPVYGQRKYYEFDNSGFCINDDNFIRIYNISTVLLNGQFYYISKSKNNTKLIIQIDDIKTKKMLNDVLNIYVCMTYKDRYYLIENNESLSFYSIIVNTQKDELNKNNVISSDNISYLYFDSNIFNGTHYAYSKMKNYINSNSSYTPFNGVNISHSFLSLSSIINKYYKKNNDILYIISYNIIKIFKDNIYNKKIDILREPLFYIFDILNEYSNFNIPLCQSPEQSENGKLFKSSSLNNLKDDFVKLNNLNKSLSFNNINNINKNINTLHNFLLTSKFYNLFNT